MRKKGTNFWIISGIAIGAAIGIGYLAYSRRKRGEWPALESIGETLSGSRQELVHAGRNVVDRMRGLLDQGRKVAEEAASFWEEGRKLLRH